ncbi:MAG: cob(I)yrinic acid a,c-diamide adenosyltransferase [Candidatus Omnitrophota bacterium]
MIQVYTGSGKGKTTAAMGLAFRALGQGKRVLLIQFLKKNSSGELKAARRFSKFSFLQCGRRAWVRKGAHTAQDKRCAQRGLSLAQEALGCNKFDLVILDEINVALHLQLLACAAVKKILRQAPRKVEIILTGRQAPGEIIKVADLVSKVQEIKHYYKQGKGPRKGIEF